MSGATRRAARPHAAPSNSRRASLPARAAPAGSEFAWAIAFLVPYAAVFAAFVVYPVGYGLWMAQRARALWRAVRRPALPDDRDQHAAASSALA